MRPDAQRNAPARACRACGGGRRWLSMSPGRPADCPGQAQHRPSPGRPAARPRRGSKSRRVPRAGCSASAAPRRPQLGDRLSGGSRRIAVLGYRRCDGAASATAAAPSAAAVRPSLGARARTGRRRRSRRLPARALAGAGSGRWRHLGHRAADARRCGSARNAPSGPPRRSRRHRPGRRPRSSDRRCASANLGRDRLLAATVTAVR